MAENTISSTTQGSSQVQADPQEPVQNSQEGNSGVEVQDTSPAVQYAANSMVNTRLHFQVDPSSHEVTVYVLDRDTEEVIRTIPPEEVNELTRGSLVEILT
jgi:uncharacterized FlaG/YvyC family protein